MESSNQMFRIDSDTQTYPNAFTSDNMEEDENPRLGLTTFSDAFTFVLLIVILIIKPTGLFGEKTTDKV